jgi:PAS domain-containing protein
MKGPLCFVDQDGVLTDFNRAALRAHGRPADFPVTGWPLYGLLGLTADEFWAALDEERHWAEMVWTPDGREILSLCERTFGRERVFILTSPSRSRGCLAGKMEWVRRHLPDYDRRVIFTNEKSLLAAPGRVLVDDYENHTRPFTAAGGRGILLPRPWNGLRAEAGRAFEHLRERLEEHERGPTG